MTSAAPRLLIGCALMAAACLTALCIGDRVVRMAAGLIAVCWALTTVGEVATGLEAESVIVGNIVAGTGLLLLAASFNTAWLWALTLVEALLFMLHAWFYGVSEGPGATLVAANNLLVLGGLVVLVVAALTHRRSGAQVPPGGPAGPK